MIVVVVVAVAVDRLNVDGSVLKEELHLIYPQGGGEDLRLFCEVGSSFEFEDVWESVLLKLRPYF